MMHDCADGDMRDLLPGYVNGTLPAAGCAAVEDHLTHCDDCAAEVAVIVAASRALPSPAVDIAGIVRALPAPPLRVKHVAPRVAFAGAAWRVAAGLGVMLLGAGSVIALRGVFAPAATRTAVVPVAPAAGGAGGAGTVVAAAKPDAPVGAAPLVASPAVPRAAGAAGKPVATSARPTATISFGGGLSDLSDDQLDALLGELDALDSIPSTEPETHLTPIVPLTPQAGGDHHAQ